MEIYLINYFKSLITFLKVMVDSWLTWPKARTRHPVKSQDGLFKKVLLKMDSNTGVSCQYCKIFKNTYFEEHLPMAAFV